VVCSRYRNLKRTCPVGIVALLLHYFDRTFLFMKFLEKDLEQIIFESGRDSLREKGLPVYGKMFRQLRIGKYGIADLVTFTRPMYDGPQRKYFVPGQITIYELKKDQIGIASFLQSLNYVKGIQRYLEKKGKQEKYIINLVIIGKELDKTGSFCYIHNLLSIKNEYYDLESNLSESGEISFYTYEYTLDGLKFNYESEYVKNDEGF
jgi:hypothetical protein